MKKRDAKHERKQNEKLKKIENKDIEIVIVKPKTENKSHKS